MCSVFVSASYSCKSRNSTANQSVYCYSIELLMRNCASHIMFCWRSTFSPTFVNQMNAVIATLHSFSQPLAVIIPRKIGWRCNRCWYIFVAKAQRFARTNHFQQNARVFFFLFFICRIFACCYFVCLCYHNYLVNKDEYKLRRLGSMHR